MEGVSVCLCGGGGGAGLAEKISTVEGYGNRTGW